MYKKFIIAFAFTLQWSQIANACIRLYDYNRDGEWETSRNGRGQLRMSGGWEKQGLNDGIFNIFTDRDNPDNIAFYLFPNPSNPQEIQQIVLGASNVTKLNFNPNVRTKFIVHGFIQNIEAEFPQNVKNAYLKRMRETGEKWNIVVVDWGKLAYELKSGLPLYDRAVRNVERTGTRLGEIVVFLMENGLIKSLDDVHLIGQSLGAHVVGAAGGWLSNKVGRQVARVTGLDPAGPLFYSGKIGRQIQTEDGKFVDVYHCNPGGLGIAGSVGEVEFYPNPQRPGNIQPQCTKFRPGYVEGPQLCSHNYCPKFFALSIIKKITTRKCINSQFFIGGYGCSSETALYGEDVPLDSTGQFFVDIKEKLDDMNIFLK